MDIPCTYCGEVIVGRKKRYHVNTCVSCKSNQKRVRARKRLPIQEKVIPVSEWKWKHLDDTVKP